MRMSTTGSELSPGQPLKGQDGKYHIRIESYDPARNTMKAIWLVSRNQRLLSQLLEKCEATNSEKADEALRGNLLSVQRELQELREAMDQHDGTKTPVLDTTELGMGCNFGNFDAGGVGSSTAAWDTNLLTSSSSVDVGDDMMTSKRASSAFGFGSGQRRCSLLSQIPLYSRPSIRTDFCTSSIEVFPWIRARKSKIPKAPPPPPKKRKTQKPNKKALGVRPKTSMSGRTSRSGDLVTSGRTSSSSSILKTNRERTRPATSMALTRSMTKRVSFGDTVEEPRKSCPSRSLSADKKKKKSAQKAVKTTKSLTRAPSTSTLNPQSTLTSAKKRQPTVRPATSLGIRTIPRSSSRLSASMADHRRSASSGRRSAMEISSTTRTKSKPTVPARKPRRRTPSKGSGETYTEIYLSHKAKEECKTTEEKTPSAASTSLTAAPEKKSAPKAVETRGVKPGAPPAKKKTAKKQTSTAKPRPKSAFDVKPRPRPDVLPFESPPPAPKILSQPIDSFLSLDSSLEDSSSPLIRSISLIDGESDLGDAFNDVRRTLPRIRVEPDQAEYRVKAYFLDELEDLPSNAPQLDSGVIPSSPVEVDSSTCQDSRTDMRPAEKSADINNRSLTSAIPEPMNMTLAECNNTKGVDRTEIKTTVLSTSDDIISDGKDRASVGASSRDQFSASVATFPELGFDYMPEFESEVHGLLDTLMSQDMLTSSLSQDLRLFSSDSNFMDNNNNPTDVSNHHRHHEPQQQQNAEERDQGENDDDDDELNGCSEKEMQTLDPVVEATAEPMPPSPEESPELSCECSIDRVVHTAQVVAAAAGNATMTGMEEEEDENNEGKPNFDDVSTESEDPARDPPLKSGSPDDDSSTGCLIGSGCVSPVGSSLECPLSVSDDDGVELLPLTVGCLTLRRRSTGSHGAAADISKSIIASANHPRRNRRSVSQTELDALLTNNNDGPSHRTRSPGSVEMGGQERRRGGQRQMIGCDSGSGVHDVDDPCSCADTSSVMSSSELTIPDPCQTYHDVHHGYSPSFSTTGDETCADSSTLKMEMTTASPRSSFHRNSFDFQSGNRFPLKVVNEVETPASENCPPPPTSPSFYTQPSLSLDLSTDRGVSTIGYDDTLSTARMLSTNEAEEFDEVEQCPVFDTRSTMSRDCLLRSTGSMSIWGDRDAKEIDSRTTPPSLSELDSAQKETVIPRSTITTTSSSSLSDSRADKKNPADDFLGLPAYSQRDAVCRRGTMKNIMLRERESQRMQLTMNSHTNNKATVPRPPDKKKKGWRMWKWSCGLYRAMRCTTSLEETDRQTA